MPQPELQFTDYRNAVAERLTERGVHLQPGAFDFFWRLHEAIALSRRADSIPALKGRGLTWTQFEVLLYLWVFGPGLMKEIAAAASVSSPALTDVAVILESRGLLTRTVYRTNRRAAQLAITSQGGVAVAEILATWNQRRRPAPGVRAPGPPPTGPQNIARPRVQQKC